MIKRLELLELDRVGRERVPHPEVEVLRDRDAGQVGLGLDDPHLLLTPDVDVELGRLGLVEPLDAGAFCCLVGRWPAVHAVTRLIAIEELDDVDGLGGLGRLFHGLSWPSNAWIG